MSKAIDQSSDQRAYWYAVWVDVDPETGVDALKVYLDGLGPDEGSRAAQLFITTLMGSSRGGRASGPNFGNFHTPGYLKSLYVLMHRHIRVTEDIDRSGGGVYSPGLRDEAQTAREGLFNLLAELPGKAAFIALSELIEEHPDPNARSWMESRARRRAEQDGDLERWTAKQIAEFGEKLTRTPKSHRQLFDLTVARLADLKDWLERGEYSPYRTWQRAADEGEIRVLVSGWLNQKWGNPFTVAQESELANRQRTDIRLQSQSVPSPVPIELKLLDKRWTGPKLCERLRNQLVGDYMREATGGCGVMLLVWQGNGPDRRWKIDGRDGAPGRTSRRAEGILGHHLQFVPRCGSGGSCADRPEPEREMHFRAGVGVVVQREREYGAVPVRNRAPRKMLLQGEPPFRTRQPPVVRVGNRFRTD